jgi:predicted AAA+ superfamily ATPase
MVLQYALCFVIMRLKMTEYKTECAMTIPRFLIPPSQSFFLFGPRGSGKTTWLKLNFPNALFINLLEPDQYRIYAAMPERLRDTLKAHPLATIIIIDEIQHVPELLPLVHSLIEERKNLQFILTGSSARKLRKVGTDLLAGRAVRREMNPYIASELGSRFSLSRALEIGMLPLIWEAQSPEDTLKAYITSYLREEVTAEGLVRNIGNFSRFLEVMSFSHAAQLTATNIARECQVSRTTTEGYIQILQDLLLGSKIEVFTRRSQRALITHPKFYYFDAGVYRSLRPQGPLDRKEDLDGAALEGLVAQHLKAWIANQTQTHSLHFWRTRSGVEVDFIVYGPCGFWAIEVKNSRTLSPLDVKSLHSFKEEYPESTPLLLYRGAQCTTVRDVLCLPCEEFLSHLRIDARLV